MRFELTWDEKPEPLGNGPYGAKARRARSGPAKVELEKLGHEGSEAHEGEGVEDVGQEVVHEQLVGQQALEGWNELLPVTVDFVWIWRAFSWPVSFLQMIMKLPF